MIRSTCLAVAVLSFSIVACSSGEISVGTAEQSLLAKKDGGSSGNGSTCSWDGVVSYDVATGKETVHSSSDGGYAVGASFKSPDGCNDCTCTAQGIACTKRACEPKACPEIAVQCPDGSYAGLGGPKCEPQCAPKPCPALAQMCPDGSTAQSGPNCEQICPGVACAQDAKQCPDGSYVSRTGPNCEFAPCP